MSFHLVMLRLDRGILRIGCGRGITRSSRVMTEKEENVGDNGRERRCQEMARRGKCQEMTIRKRKLIITTKEKKPLKAVRETSRITEI